MQGTIVSEYPSTPEFLAHHIHTYVVSLRKVLYQINETIVDILFQVCPCKDIQFGSVQQVFDTESFHPCTTGTCQAMSAVGDMDMFNVIILLNLLYT